MSVSRSFTMRTTPLGVVLVPYDDTAMKSSSTGRSIAGEIAHEHERALEDTDEQGAATLIISCDLCAEFGHPGGGVVGGNDRAADRTGGDVAHRGDRSRCSVDRVPDLGDDPTRHRRVHVAGRRPEKRQRPGPKPDLRSIQLSE